jgi:hypothetical protein
MVLLVPCLVAASLSSPSARGDSVKSKCPDLEKCAHAVATLTGTKLVFDPEILKGAIGATENFELTKENADVVFTQMLDQNGLTRVPIADANAYTILRQRNARDSALPRFDADAKTTPEIPKTWDLGTLRYRLAHPELAETIARTLRSFLPATSRVIPEELSGHLIVVASFPILANVLNLAQSMDVKAPRPREAERRARANRRTDNVVH